MKSKVPTASPGMVAAPASVSERREREPCKGCYRAVGNDSLSSATIGEHYVVVELKAFCGASIVKYDMTKGRWMQCLSM